MARKKFTAAFKAQVALQCLKDEVPLAELAARYQVHPTQIKDWKNILISQVESLFAKKGQIVADNSDYIEALERKAGQLAIEIDFLKKNLNVFHKKNV